MTAPRLFGRDRTRMSAVMRARPVVPLLLVSLLLPVSAAGAAETKPPAKPAAAPVAAKPSTAKPAAIGKFEDWTAATNTEAGQKVCYAFVRASGSTPSVPGRGEVVLTVTQRPQGRDAVAISAGFAYPANAAVTVAVETTILEFYTSQRSAFARDGGASVKAFMRGRQVVAKSPQAKGPAVTDTFSLKGFSAAYAAITKACPPK